MGSMQQLLRRATLVVCAVSLAGQWLEEAKSKLDGSLKLYMYHGSSRKRDTHYLATTFDLVVTTYQVLLYYSLQAASKPPAQPHDRTGPIPTHTLSKMHCFRHRLLL